MTFAMTEMTLIAATLLQHPELSLPPGFAEPQPQVHVALRPGEPLVLRWQPRPTPGC